MEIRKTFDGKGDLHVILYRILSFMIAVKTSYLEKCVSSQSSFIDALYHS